MSDGVGPKFKVGDLVRIKDTGKVGRIKKFGRSEDYQLNYYTVQGSPCDTVQRESSIELASAAGPLPYKPPTLTLRANGKSWAIKDTPDAALRKMQPIGTVLKSYFGLGFRGVAAVAHVGNEKHNPGTPLHWERGKSDDHLDCAARHLSESDDWDVTVLPDGRAFAVLHAAQAAWRALALAQLEAEKHSGRVIYELEPIPVGETAQDRP